MTPVSYPMTCNPGHMEYEPWPHHRQPKRSSGWWNDANFYFLMLSKLRIQYGIARELFNLVKYSLYLASRDGLSTGERPFISSHLGPEFVFFRGEGGHKLSFTCTVPSRVKFSLTTWHGRAQFWATDGSTSGWQFILGKYPSTWIYPDRSSLPNARAPSLGSGEGDNSMED